MTTVDCRIIVNTIPLEKAVRELTVLLQYAPQALAERTLDALMSSPDMTVSHFLDGDGCLTVAPGQAFARAFAALVPGGTTSAPNRGVVVPTPGQL